MRASPLTLFSRIAVRLRGSGSVEYEFHPLWLRINDPGKVTRNQQRLFEISDVVQNTTSSQVERFTSETAGLKVDWADGHRSVFPWEWLEAQVRPKRLERHLWSAGFQRFLPELPYSELASDMGKLRLSGFLARYGLAVLRGVPTEAGMVEKVGNEIGYVRVTNYGAIFDVVDKGSQGNNLAQTNCRIGAHTDNPYRDPFPGVQMLHCIKSASDGGATVFTDGFAAATKLRQEDPEAFALLVDTPQPYEYRDPETNVLLRAEVPVLTLDAEGNLERVAFNNRSAAPLRGPIERVEPYYRAWAKFDALCNSSESTVRVRMRPGDLAIFLNSRVMHGREEYAPGGERFLQGCYVDHDALHSRVSLGLAEGEDLSSSCVHTAAAEACLEALKTQAEYSYGEGVNMLSHALQAAMVAEEQGESTVAILACLLHDIGNTPQARKAWVLAGNDEPDLMVSEADGSIGYRYHEEVGAAYVEGLGFSAEVASAVRLHVSAKRALVTMEPAYMEELSQASKDTLKEQGGPMSVDELTAFHSAPGAQVALRLRQYDDMGKVPDRGVPGLEHYLERMADHLRQESAI